MFNYLLVTFEVADVSFRCIRYKLQWRFGKKGWGQGRKKVAHFWQRRYYVVKIINLRLHFLKIKRLLAPDIAFLEENFLTG